MALTKTYPHLYFSFKLWRLFTLSLLIFPEKTISLETSSYICFFDHPLNGAHSHSLENFYNMITHNYSKYKNKGLLPFYSIEAKVEKLYNLNAIIINDFPRSKFPSFSELFSIDYKAACFEDLPYKTQLNEPSTNFLSKSTNRLHNNSPFKVNLNSKKCNQSQVPFASEPKLFNLQFLTEVLTLFFNASYPNIPLNHKKITNMYIGNKHDSRGTSKPENTISIFKSTDKAPTTNFTSNLKEDNLENFPNNSNNEVSKIKHSLSHDSTSSYISGCNCNQNNKSPLCFFITQGYDIECQSYYIENKSNSDSSCILEVARALDFSLKSNASTIVFNFPECLSDIDTMKPFFTFIIKAFKNCSTILILLDQISCEVSIELENLCTLTNLNNIVYLSYIKKNNEYYINLKNLENSILLPNQWNEVVNDSFSGIDLAATQLTIIYTLLRIIKQSSSTLSNFSYSASSLKPFKQYKSIDQEVSFDTKTPSIDTNLHHFTHAKFQNMSTSSNLEYDIQRRSLFFDFPSSKSNIFDSFFNELSPDDFSFLDGLAPDDFSFLDGLAPDEFSFLDGLAPDDFSFLNSLAPDDFSLFSGLLSDGFSFSLGSLADSPLFKSFFSNKNTGKFCVYTNKNVLDLNNLQNTYLSNSKSFEACIDSCIHSDECTLLLWVAPNCNHFIGDPSEIELVTSEGSTIIEKSCTIPGGEEQRIPNEQIPQGLKGFYDLFSSFVNDVEIREMYDVFSFMSSPLYNWARGIPQAVQNKTEMLPLPSIPNPTTACATEGMTCCIPELAAPNWVDPEFLPHVKDSITDDICRARYNSLTNSLCVSLLFNDKYCGVEKIETEQYISYQLKLINPEPTMNNAICQCIFNKKTYEGEYSTKLSSNTSIASGDATLKQLEDINSTSNLETRSSGVWVYTQDLIEEYFFPDNTTDPGLLITANVFSSIFKRMDVNVSSLTFGDFLKLLQN